MEGHLSLIKSGKEHEEKRIFPRFPFSYLIFKPSSKEGLSFLIRDISFSGMQLGLKSGEHFYKSGETIEGQVHWKGRSLEIKAQVVWVKDLRLGVRFVQSDEFDKEIHDFLSIDKVVEEMRAIHENPVGVEVPSNLRVWLKADGPFELFVWTHSDGEVSRFQLLMMDQFVEYEDGKGLQSGKVLRIRDRETPLFSEDEFIFSMDSEFDADKHQLGKELINKISDDLLSPEIRNFLIRKLG